VPVVLWEITEACERALDKYEGVASGVYEKVQIPLDNGETALTYVMRSKGVFPPKREYFDRIAQGYADFNIDREALDVALKHSHVKQEHSVETRRRMVRDIAGGNVIRARKPMHVPLSKVTANDPSVSIETRGATTMNGRKNDYLCRHGWPVDVCEDCSAAPMLPLPKPDPRYDGYNWSDRAREGTAKSKQRVVYSDRETKEKGAKIVADTHKRMRTNKRSTTTKYKNLSDYMKAKGYSGENH
jgi:hypothetical protein